MMAQPTISAADGTTTFEFGAGLVFEISKAEQSRWGGTNAHIRVLDHSLDESPLLGAGTIRLDDIRERERFCQTLQRRDGKVDDWPGHLLLIADHISQHAPTASAATPVVVRLNDVEREDVEWMEVNRVAKGKVHMLDGDPGVGKTFITHAFMAAATTGAPLFGEGDRREPARALLLTAEDGLGDTVRPRIEDMGGDLSRITVLTAVRKGDGEERHLSLVDDLSALGEVLSEGGYDVVIIDPINAYLGTELDTNRDAALRSVLTPIAALAAKHRVAIILVRHLTKGSRDRAIYRGQGSIAYTAAARLAMIVGKNPDNEGERVIAWVKNNLGPEAPAIAFSLNDGQFRWLGETDVTASALVAPEQGPEERSALEEAKAFLRAALSEGPVSAADVMQMAKSEGHSERTIKRAKSANELAIISRPEGEAGRRGVRAWIWQLPDADDSGAGGPVKGANDIKGASQAGAVGPLNQPPLAPARVESAIGPLNNIVSTAAEEVGPLNTAGGSEDSRESPEEVKGARVPNTTRAHAREERHDSGAHRPASASDPAGSLAYCLALAVALDYPPLEFRSGETILEGGRNWGLFLRENEHDPGAVTTAIAALEALGEREPVHA